MSAYLMTKAPADVLDFDVDFARWLSDADKIVGATATLSNGTAAIDQVEFSETGAKVWISGGVDTEVATVSVVITTAQGRTKEHCFRLKVKDCH